MHLLQSDNQPVVQNVDEQSEHKSPDNFDENQSRSVTKQC